MRAGAWRRLHPSVRLVSVRGVGSESSAGSPVTDVMAVESIAPFERREAQLFVAVVGAIIVLVLYHAITGRSGR